MILRPRLSTLLVCVHGAQWSGLGGEETTGGTVASLPQIAMATAECRCHPLARWPQYFVPLHRVFSSATALPSRCGVCARVVGLSSIRHHHLLVLTALLMCCLLPWTQRETCHAGEGCQREAVCRLACAGSCPQIRVHLPCGQDHAACYR